MTIEDIQKAFAEKGYELIHGAGKNFVCIPPRKISDTWFSFENEQDVINKVKDDPELFLKSAEIQLKKGLYSSLEYAQKYREAIGY